MTGKIVFDASVSAKWVIEEQDSVEAHGLLQRALTNHVLITVPPLWGYELESTIRFRLYRREMSEDDASRAYVFIDKMPIVIRHLPGVRMRARIIARQANQRRVYDSVYAAHAEAEKCDLWTADYDYFRAVRGFLNNVRYLGDR